MPSRPITLKTVVQSAPSPLSSEAQALLQKAYQLAERAHAGETRKSGQPYITHPLHVAKILAEIGMDERALAAAILHDVPENTTTSLEDIRSAFGEEISYLVDGVTKLGKVRLRGGSQQEMYLENLRKMFLAMAQDIRVVIIKLADRMHNMRTLEHLPPEKQLRIARETMEIYAPIANRLGIGEFKSELEDLSFRYLDPENYAVTEELARTYLRDGEQYIREVVDDFKRKLKEAKIPYTEVSGRQKHLYRLYQKLKSRDMNIRRVYDLVAIRIIVPEIPDCYEALGIIHREYRPMVGRIKDYISLPKPNGYQSLHTTIFGPQGRIIEIQIRTQKMHDEAEYGIAAHWLYIEKYRLGWRNLFLRRRPAVPAGPKEVRWIAQLREWQKDVGQNDQEFLEGLQAEFFKNHIFAFTPQGDIIELPEDATPVDFAYAIHTEVGHRTVGAKADGTVVPLDHRIENAEMIEILTSDEPKKPDPGWLRFVKTSSARQSIRHALREEAPRKDMASGGQGWG